MFALMATEEAFSQKCVLFNENRQSFVIAIHNQNAGLLCQFLKMCFLCMLDNIK